MDLDKGSRGELGGCPGRRVIYAMALPLLLVLYRLLQKYTQVQAHRFEPRGHRHSHSHGSQPSVT